MIRTILKIRKGILKSSSASLGNYAPGDGSRLHGHWYDEDGVEIVLVFPSVMARSLRSHKHRSKPTHVLYQTQPDFCVHSPSVVPSVKDS